jgi:nitric oxide reductase subunit B
LLQTIVGGASQHYGYGLFLALCALGLDALARHSHRRAERYRTGGFTYHVQLAIFFVATSFVAAGIFQAPMIAGREPRGQAELAYALLGALVVECSAA